MVIELNISYLHTELLSIGQDPEFTKRAVKAVKNMHVIKLDKIGIRGPYGHSFLLKGKFPLIIGSGIGMAPFLFLIRKLQKVAKKITVINGARIKNELLFFNKFQKFSEDGLDCIFTTNDTSFGGKGVANSITIRELQDGFHDQVYTIGPNL
ncbi:MAG: hypothetical protein ACFFD2_04990 [Promethearchaeota archaeon]